MTATTEELKYSHNRSQPSASGIHPPYKNCQNGGQNSAPLRDRSFGGTIEVLLIGVAFY
jgi:hypothetical protein